MFADKVCQHEGDATRYASHAVHQNVSAAKLGFDQVDHVFKVLRNVKCLVVNRRDIQILNVRRELFG